ncbi:MAG: 3-keto-5-aminohexanoate cleavage protein, partial [Planctomycetota bacterium]
LEDNVWMDDARTRLATNEALVERVVSVAREAGREPATPAAVRARLALA